MHGSSELSPATVMGYYHIKHVWGMSTHPTDRSKVDTSEEERVMVKRHFEQDF